MKINQFGLDSKQYLDCEKFKSVLDYVTENVKSDETSYELLNLVLEYLQNYPQQISLVSTSNTHYLELFYAVFLFLIYLYLHVKILLQNVSFILYQSEK